MDRSRCFIFLTAILSLAIAGCEKPSAVSGGGIAVPGTGGKIVGEWRGSGPSGVGGNLSSYALTLGADRNYVYVVNGQESKGSYQYDDGAKTITMSPSTEAWPVAWTGDNQITITSLTGDALLTRS